MHPKPVRLIVSLIPQIIAVSMLFLALSAKNPYSFYIVLRIVVFSCGAYLLYQAFQLGRTVLSWLLIVAVLLYNPFFRVHLTRPTWFVINLLTIALFVSVTVYCNVGRGKSKGVAEKKERETGEPDQRVVKQYKERIEVLEKEADRLEKQREWFSSMIDPL